MVTASQVKELREKTGAGMMDCKKVLTEADGDMEKAIELLRERGIAKAAKKSDRVAAEGLVGSYISEDGKVGAIAEVNAETDFVAENAEFKQFVNDVVKQVALNNPADVEALLEEKFIANPEKTVKEALINKIATIGENITIRRFVRYEGPVATYIHNGKIGVLLSTDKEDKDLMNDICLHIASSAPKFVSRAEIPQSEIDEETRIEMGKEDLLKKPENIRAKIVEGRVNKLMAERCFLEQPFVKDPSQTISQLIEGKLTIKAFTRYELGEGLEKRQDNFAEEVMAQVKG